MCRAESCGEIALLCRINQLASSTCRIGSPNFMNSSTCKRLALLFGISVGMQFVVATTANAITSNWIETGAGPFSWVDATRWDSNPTAPIAISDTATFGTLAGPATQNITL